MWTLLEYKIFWADKKFQKSISKDLHSFPWFVFKNRNIIFQAWGFSQRENESLDLFIVLFNGTYNFSSPKSLILQTVTVLHCSCDGFEQNIFCSNSISPFPCWTWFVKFFDSQCDTLMEFKMTSCFLQKIESFLTINDVISIWNPVLLWELHLS